jgi:hypothetical protein
MAADVLSTRELPTTAERIASGGFLPESCSSSQLPYTPILGDPSLAQSDPAAADTQSAPASAVDAAAPAKGLLSFDDPFHFDWPYW